MTNVFLDHTATGAADGSDWANAYTTVAAAEAAMVAGDTLVMAVGHSEDPATLTLAFPSDSKWITSTVSGVDTVTYSKATSANLAQTTANADINVSGVVQIFGVWIETADTFKTQGTNSVIEFNDCTLKWASVTSGGKFHVGSATKISVVLRNSHIARANTGNNTWYVDVDAGNSSFEMIGGSASADCIFTSGQYCFNHRNADNGLNLSGVDCSGLDAVNLVNKGTSNLIRFAQAYNCRLHANTVSLVLSADLFSPFEWMEFINCDSSDAGTQYKYLNWRGVVDSDTGIYRVGGAEINGTPASFKVVVDADATLYSAFRYLLHTTQVDTSTAKSFTVELARNDSTVPLTDAEVWIEVEYQDGTTALVNFADDKVASITGTPANQPTSSETWSGLGGTNVKQYCSVTLPGDGELGICRIWLYLAEPDITVFVCPRVVVT